MKIPTFEESMTAVAFKYGYNSSAEMINDRNKPGRKFDLQYAKEAYEIGIQKVIDSVQVVVSGDISITPIFNSTNSEEECEYICGGCGECIDDLSDYYKIEGYCKDCL